MENRNEKSLPMLLNQEDAAKFLDCSPRNLEALRHRGGGPRFVKLGRRVRYRVCDLLDWIDSNVRSSTGEQAGALLPAGGKGK